MGKLTGKLKRTARKGKAAAGKTESKAKKGTRKTARKVDRAV
jgi:hypothetical protein